MATPVVDLANGDYLLPPGKIAMVVTYLEQLSPPDRAVIAAPEGTSLQRWHDVTVETYLDLFRAIGEPWLWFGRLLKTPQQLTDLFRDPRHQIYVVTRGQRRVGLLELAYQDEGNVEVSYFGLVPDETGRGAGQWLMDEAQRLAWSKPITKRLWVHTCTADHPAAIAFYQKMGFMPYARGIEIADDPRLNGIYAPNAGPVALPFMAADASGAR